MPNTITPVPPVTWNVQFELSDQERAAWKAFLYRLRDGQVQTGLDAPTLATLNNTASRLYELFDEGYLDA